MSVKSGDLFIFQVNDKYGVIQVIEKSKISGYNVRVFCDLIEEISDNLIDTLMQSNRYYFIKDFYSNDLMKCVCKKSRYIDDKIIMPKYMRSSERKVNGNIVWYIIDVKTGCTIKKFNSFDEELKDLSPAEIWGIEYIKKRWLEDFDLEKWNDKLLDIWYLNYLKKYEPEKVYKFHINQMKNNSILEKWDKEKRISQELFELLEICFNDFINGISILNNSNKDKLLKHFIIKLNKLNEKFNFIQTIEREELVEYINYLLSVNEIVDDNDIIDKHRNW